MNLSLKLLAGTALVLALGTTTASAQVLFWSTQAAPIEVT